MHLIVFWGAIFSSFACTPFHAGSPTQLAAEQTPKRVFVDLFYGTDRNHSVIEKDEGLANDIYGSERGRLSLGVCRVSVSTEKNDRTGFAEPKNWPVDEQSTLRGSAQVQAIRPLTPAGLRQHVSKQKGSDTALVYIHGYAKSFSEAAVNAATFVYEINHRGPVFLYSWPSQGSAVAYVGDVAAVDWSIPNLTRFLNDIANMDNIGPVQLVAHSLGNRALLGVLVEMIDKRDHQQPWPFVDVVMLAPDVDKAVFERDILSSLNQSSSRISLYVSSADVPLKMSKVFNFYPRLGDARFLPLSYQGVETIDVTPSSSFLRGHSYYRREGSVMTDLYYLLNRGQGAAQRPDLEPVGLQGNRYWRLEVD